MSKSIICSLLLGILFSLTPLLYPPHSVAQESIVLTNGEWPPFFSEDFEHGGLGSHIVKQAFAKVGVDVTYEYLPWKRGFEIARDGQRTGALGWRKTAERERDFYFSDPIISANVVLFYREDIELNWETLDDIGHLTVGGTLGYSYIKPLTRAVARNGGKLDIAPTDEMNLQKLAVGRIDVFPVGKVVGYYLLRSKFTPGTADTVRHHPKPLISSPIHLVISKKIKKGPEIIARFNKGLRLLHESGEYEQFELESLRGDYLPGWDKLAP